MNNSIETIFATARELQAADRSEYLDDVCSGDAELRSQVEALLAADMDAGSFLKSVEHDPDATLPQTRQMEKQDIPSEAVGQLIGKYKLLEEIGEGGFGSVWAAEQKVPVKRRVALKIIKLGMDTKQVIARFEAERQALAMMDHPNIAKVLDAGTTETGRPFFVMELVKGVPILDYCDTEKLDTKARLDLFTKVCHAIQHAHQKGIIHRDIKPGNVLVTLHDGVPVPKVIDFGIAKATNAELTEKTIYTQHHQMIGTPAYMSPEQAEMSGLDIDTRSDIYSLGVLLYELLTGTTPFAHNELMARGFGEMMRIIREETPHKPSTRLSTLGETSTRTAEQRHTDIKKLGLVLRGDLDWIVMKCLEKDRTRRYETANGLAADIVRHLNDEPVVAGPPSTKYKLAKFVKRNRGQVLAAGIVAAVLVLGAVGTSAGMVWAVNEKSRADEQASRATQIKGMVTDMLRSADPDVARGADTALMKGILDEAGERLASGEITDPVIAGELHSVLGEVYKKLGLFDEADQHLPKAVALQTDALGEGHPDTLSSSHQLVGLYLEQGRYDEAEPIALRTLELYRRVLGDQHEDTVRAWNGLGKVYLYQGRYEECEAMCDEALVVARRELGDEHEVTIRVMNLLSVLYSRTKRTDESHSLNVEMLRLMRKTEGEDHPNTIMTLQNVAYGLQRQGRYDEAEPMYLQAIEGYRRVLGAEHPDTLWAANNLAVMYRIVGRYDDAESLMLENAEARERTLGVDHPDTLQSWHALVQLYLDQHRLDDAVALGERLLAGRRRTLGKDHPASVKAMAVLAKCYRIQERWGEANPLVEEALEITRRMRGEEHPSTLSVMNELGSLYYRQGRFEDCEVLYTEVLEINRRVHGEEHASTLQAMHNMGVLAQGMRRPDQAETWYRQALEKRERVLGTDHPDTMHSLNNLGNVLWKSDRLEEAASALEECLIRRQRALGPDARDFHATMNDLSSVYRELGEFEKSEELSKVLIEHRKRTLGAEHPATLLSMEGLGITYSELGRWAEAEPLYIQVLAGRRRALGNEHWHTLGIITNLGQLYNNMGRHIEAAVLLDESVPAKRRVLGMEHPWTDIALNELAKSYTGMLRFDDLIELTEVYEQELGEDHERSLEFLDSVANLLDDNGMKDDAEAMCLKIIERGVRTHGEDSKTVLNARIRLGLMYSDRQRYEEAEPMLVAALETSRRIYGNEAQRTLGVLTNLGGLYNSMGRHDEAAVLLEESLEAKRRVLGMDHDWTRFASDGLIHSYEQLGREDEALALRREKLEHALSGAESPDADARTLNFAAWELLTHDLEALHDPERALEYAQRACAIEEASGGDGLFMYLDTLALAQYRTGDTAGAIATQRRSISLMNADHPDRAEYEQRLAEYEAAAMETDGPGNP